MISQLLKAVTLGLVQGGEGTATEPLRNRALLPLSLSAPSQTDAGGSHEDLPVLSNIQGDVFIFPKDAEAFIFFRISDVSKFKGALATFKPTSAADVVENLSAIRRAKLEAKGRRVELTQQQIAFTRAGLNILGLKEESGDQRFDKFCMRDNKTVFGDVSTWNKTFDRPNFNPATGTANVDDGALHGVVSIAASDLSTVRKAADAFKVLFECAVDVVDVIEGKIRPGKMRGHDHFGYRDGVSQPAIRGLTGHLPGQTQVDVGVIIAGYEGDPAFSKRPKWAKDGTFMVFKQFEQDVVRFDKHLKKSSSRWREFDPPVPLQEGETLTDEQAAQLCGARMVGRWPSGAPLAKCPVFDDPDMALDPERRNDFDYTVPDIHGPTNKYCPFTAHTRKVAPRNLDPYLQKKFIEASSIIRAGTPYGDELPSETSRGLLFVCYQSHLDSGFVRQAIQFSRNDYFPPISVFPQAHGQDAIIGGPQQLDEGPIVPAPTEGTDQYLQWDPTSNNAVPVTSVEVFVTSRGGEYFFVPSLSVLKEVSESWEMLL
ncbi:hypothetical protein ID866_6326 [Astraeus odoratus]|nr:hypothetical protein ID866_6326 [Astraeus odoratus]